MNLLLDTHVFLWYISDDPKLPVAIFNSIRDRSNHVYLSVVSVWEAVIKHKLGKLALPAPPAIFLPQQRESHEITSLPVDENAMQYLASLPTWHRDPFDRLLIAQTLQHQFVFATVDPEIAAYPVPLHALK
ncbi:MAG: type II toxin-antitoxin system VapC family toxin [Planctomycetes bacterium]|nr:type II toxin-antitoxin system VapC family toxin [Planctomycetota bacterium]